MSQESLQGVSRRRGVTTTQRTEDARPAPDLVDRDFTAEGILTNRSPNSRGVWIYTEQPFSYLNPGDN
jgi:hypothetical protein